MINQRTGLQKLAQLVNLDFFIHLVQPLLGLLHGLAARRVHLRLKIGAGGHVDHELARQFGVNGMKAAGTRPQRRKIRSLVQVAMTVAKTKVAMES